MGNPNESLGSGHFPSPGLGHRGVPFQRKELRALSLWNRYIARRHRKEHERVEAARARQKALAGQDVEEAVRAAAQGSAVSQQGIYGQSQPG